ncbi:MAG: hypothetical protein ACRDRH_10455 [Pseudonocardia sp.]
MDVGTPADKTYVPNEVLVSLRKSKSWGRERLARQFEFVGRKYKLSTPDVGAMLKQIYRLETGRILQPSKLYEDLYCKTFNTSSTELFGALTPPQAASETFKLRNHKLVPAYIGPQLAERAIAQLSMQAASDQWLECYSCPVDHPRREVSADLWVWPFGVALFHLTETVESTSLADFAIWHRRVYDEQMNWVCGQLKLLLESSSRAQYAMPVNWLVRSVWQDAQLGTALRILSMPRVLLQREFGGDASDLAYAEVVERSLLRNGFDSADASEFGLKGVSAGVASWAGVVYCPIAASRALSESEVLAFELTVQATWSYCDWIRGEVEAVRDPDVPAEYGWRLLRALRSVIINPRPEESSQVFPMRTAVLATSGIREHLRQATEAMIEARSR